MKNYYVERYDKFWERQTKKYGISKYEKYLIHRIIKRNPEVVFEVGIGNGWPIGTALHAKGITVHGCDVSPRLVASARKNLECKDGIYAGELKDCLLNREYPMVYCVRTSWYIVDFEDVLRHMISLTESGGSLIFDIMEFESLYHLKYFISRIALTIKGKMLKIIGIESDKTPPLNFYGRRAIEKVLMENQVQFCSYQERCITKSKDYWNTPKRVYICKK